jgi:hypothetical protein
MTRTHSAGHCGHAEVIPWQQCTCICGGNEHPDVGGYYKPLVGGGGRLRMTAVPTGPEPNGPERTEGERRRMRSTFALATKLVHPDLMAELAELVCETFSHDFELQATPGTAPDRRDIARRQELARLLVATAGDVRSGRPIDPVSEQFFKDLLCAPTAEVAHFFALVLCGYLADTERSTAIADCVADLRLTLLVNHVRGRYVGPRDRSELARLLVPDAGFVRVRADVGEGVDRHLRGADGGDLELDHILCGFLLLLVDVLSIPGKAVDVAASTIENLTVDVAIARGRSPLEAQALGLAAKWLATYLGGVALDQMTVGGMRTICQLMAVAFCPDLDEHPEIEERCLRPLVTEQLKQRLTSSIKVEVDKLIQNAA